MVTLAELTYHLDLTDEEQWVAASFAGSTGPWTDAQARELVEGWARYNGSPERRWIAETAEKTDHKLSRALLDALHQKGWKLEGGRSGYSATLINATETRTLTINCKGMRISDIWLGGQMTKASFKRAMAWLNES